MNRSQLLFKINTLEYGINRKKAEYERAIQSKDESTAKDLKATLEYLEKDLADTRELFEKPEEEETKALPVVNEKRSWWSLLFFRTAVDKK